MALICSSACSTCTGCCCRKEICAESVESVWLKLVWETFDQGVPEYNDSTGWLSQEGCQLPVGRPPVCYEYFCSRLLGEIRTGFHLDVLQRISKLVSHVGEKALGSKHLITLSYKQIMTSLNYEKLMNRILNCHQRFDERRKEWHSLMTETCLDSFNVNWNSYIIAYF